MKELKLSTDTTLKLIGLKQELFELSQHNESLKIVYHKFLETLATIEKAGLFGGK